MKYLDDILFLLGIGSLVYAAYRFNVTIGFAALGVALIVSAYLVGRFLLRHPKGRDKH